MKRALENSWFTESHGGYWSIVSIKGDIIASEIPHGAVADHIVNLHNADVKAKFEASLCPKCRHYKHSSICGRVNIDARSCECKGGTNEAARTDSEPGASGS